MPRSAYQLAALATAAVPGLKPVGAHESPGADSAFDAAVVHDSERRRWEVRAPRTAAAGAALESEVRLLAALADRAAGDLSFAVPRPAGFAALPEGGRAVVHPHIDGRPLDPQHLEPASALATSVGRALARLHDLPHRLVEDVGLPVYTAAEYRDRRLAEVDRAAATGHVPTRLLSRWETAMEDVGRWRFQPAVVHGDLAAEHLLVSGDEVVGMVGWAEAKVADPADDLAWLAVGAEPAATESVLEAYAMARRGEPDRHLAERARLAGELALARWLLHGVVTDDTAVVSDAVQMLRDLDEDVAETPL